MDEELPLPLSQRLSPRQWTLLDGALATLLFGGTVAGIATGHESGSPTGWLSEVLRYAVTGIVCVGLPLRRWRPIAVLSVVAPGVATLLALGVRGPVIVVVALVVYSAAAASTHRLSVVTVGAVAAIALVGALVAAGGPEWGSVISVPAVVLAGWLAGENTRARRTYAKGVAQRTAEREREREQRVRQAASEERVRIARELHDIVAHAMSLIAVRAGAARVVVDTQPDEVREGLSIIETTSRRALRDIRRVVGVLREPDERMAELAPAPRLDDLEELVRHTKHTGVHVDLRVEGEPRRLAPGWRSRPIALPRRR